MQKSWKEMLQQHQAFNAAKGATVPGKPLHPGENNPKNDTVLAKVTPEEIVLPLSVTQHPNAPEMAKQFVEKELAKRHSMKDHFDDGGNVSAQPTPSASPSEPNKANAAAVQKGATEPGYAKEGAGWQNLKSEVGKVFGYAKGGNVHKPSHHAMPVPVPGAVGAQMPGMPMPHGKQAAAVQNMNQVMSQPVQPTMAPVDSTPVAAAQLPQFSKGGMCPCNYCMGGAAYSEGGNVLDAHARAHIAAKNFALPGGRYPIHDAAHARNALARVSQYGSPEEKATVRAAVAKRYPGIVQHFDDGGTVAPNDGTVVLPGVQGGDVPTNASYQIPVASDPLTSTNNLADLEKQYGDQYSGKPTDYQNNPIPKSDIGMDQSNFTKSNKLEELEKEFGKKAEVTKPIDTVDEIEKAVKDVDPASKDVLAKEIAGAEGKEVLASSAKEGGADIVADIGDKTHLTLDPKDFKKVEETKDVIPTDQAKQAAASDLPGKGFEAPSLTQGAMLSQAFRQATKGVTPDNYSDLVNQAKAPITNPLAANGVAPSTTIPQVDVQYDKNGKVTGGLNANAAATAANEAITPEMNAAKKAAALAQAPIMGPPSDLATPPPSTQQVDNSDSVQPKAPPVPMTAKPASVAAPLPPPVPTDLPTSTAQPSYLDLLKRAQAQAANTQRNAAIIKGGALIGEAFGNRNSSVPFKVDTSITDEMSKNAQQPVTDILDQMKAKGMINDQQLAGLKLKNAQNLASPTSAVSNNFTDIMNQYRKPLGLAPIPQGTMSAMDMEPVIANYRDNSDLSIKQKTLQQKYTDQAQQREVINQQKEAAQQYKQAKDDETQDDKITKELNDLQASGRSALGLASKTKVSGNRLLQIVNSPDATVQDMASAAADQAQMVGSGSSTISGAHSQEYNNLATQMAHYASYLTSSPQAPDVPEVKKHIAEVTQKMMDISDNVISQNTARIRAGHTDWIKRNPDKWQQKMDAMGDTSQATGAGNAAITPDVASYAASHNITPQQALAIKKQRMGAQ